MRRPRTTKKRKGARHSSRDRAAAVVFRLTGIVSTRAVAAPATAEPTPARTLSALLPDVTPLDGSKRVARERDGAPSDARVATRPRKAVAFVLERDGDRIQGHRADLGPPRLAPGHGRTWVPDERLDLHGVRARELEARLDIAIRQCLRRPRGRLLVIHGKGLHSAGGAGVLAEAVVELLTAERHGRHVRAFSTAPARLGGSGALAVELELRGS
jgi:DNA-nicking Smr family endonuclease